MIIQEPKKEILKAIVSHIIHESHKVYDIIEKRKDCALPRFFIEIKDDNLSMALKNECHIIIGIGSLSKLYNICSDFCKTYQMDYSIGKSIINKIEDNNICIDAWGISEQDLDGIKLFEEDTIDSAGILVINALTYTIYHEFGHIKYDEDDMKQIDKEKKADKFAMELVKGKCIEYPLLQMDIAPAFLGALLDNILILYDSNPQKLEESTTHPHPIERIYYFLEYFDISEESYIWEYVYDMIIKWMNENHIALKIKKNCSISAKEQLYTINNRFKK